jgi:hypothetical protein
VRVFAVAQVLELLEGEGHGAAAGQVARDHGVVGARLLEDLHGALQAKGLRYFAVLELGEEIDVHRRIAKHDDVTVVLRRGAQHRRAADVDLLDHLGQRDALFRDGGLERVEVHDHEVDSGDVEPRDVGEMVGIVAVMEDRAEDLGCQRLDAPTENLRCARPLRDRRHGNAGVRQVLGRTAGGEDLHALRGQRAGEIENAGLVGNGEDGACDCFSWGHSVADCPHA